MVLVLRKSTRDGCWCWIVIIVGLMSVCALVRVSVSGLCIWNPSLASGAKTTGGVLEMTKEMFHEGSLGRQMSRTSMEIAW